MTPLHKFLHPCELSAHREAHELSTVLGSCVAICLYAPTWRAGGMNHFMLPLWNGEGLPTPKYGNVALDLLLRRLEALQVERSGLVAKVFGGAHVMGELTRSLRIGERNVQVALELLDRAAIEVVAQDVGGHQARKVHFNTSTGVARVGRLALDPSQSRALPGAFSRNAG